MIRAGYFRTRLSFGAYVGCILSVVLYSYWNILDSYFLSDDFNHIFGLYRPDGSLRWDLALEHWVSSQHVAAWRPLVTAYELAMLWLFGVSPMAFHLGNLALHLANCLLLATLVKKVGEDARLPGAHGAAAAAGLLFAAQPLHPEAVTWIAANPVLLCGIFYMASLLFVRQWILHSRPPWLALALACAVLALAGKEEAVSLPGMVALIGGVTFISRFGFAKLPRWFGRYFVLMCVFAGLLILYFILRRHIFGSALSVVSLEGEQQVGLYALAVYHNVLRFFSPVNFEHAAEVGWSLARLYGGVTATVLVLASITALRAGAWRFLAALSVAAAALLILLVPAYPVMVSGPGPGLDLSRFLYLPSAAAVSAACLALFGVSLSFSLLRVAALSVLMALNILVLRVNNEAWRVAGETMATMQHEALRLAARDVRAEVINLPDTIAGVYFDRGGWSFARLAPFADGGGPGLAYRQVRLINDLDRPVTLELEGADVNFGPEEPLPDAVQAGEMLTIDWRFDPSVPGSRRGRLIGRDGCSGMTLLTATGVGRAASPTQTGIWGKVVSAERPSPERMDLELSVISAAGAPTALGVRVSVPPDGPFEITETPSPFDLEGGEDKRLSLSLHRRADAPAWPVQPILVEADNAIPIPLALEEPLFLPAIDGVEGGARAVNSSLARPGDSGTVSSFPLSLLCGESKTSQGAGHQLDFGWLPVTPVSGRTGEAVTVRPATPPIRLFWDDVNRVLVPYDRVTTAPVVLAAGPAELMRWTPYDEDKTYRHDAGMSITALSQGPLGFTSPMAEINPLEVSYLFVEMRSMMTPGPYAQFGWSRDGNNFVLQDVVYQATQPDGRWRTYAVPLHSNASWREGGLIRQIRYFPSLSGGYAEVRSIKLIGPVFSEE